jgi:PAS domain-containing protein
MSRSQQRFSSFRSNEQRSAVAASDWLSAGQRAVETVSDVDLVQFAITQEEWLRFQEHSPNGFIRLHPAHDSAQRILNFQLIYANQSAQRMLGQKSSDLLGRRLLEIVPAMEVSLDRLVEAFESGVGQVIQQRIETRTGTCRWRIVAARLGDGLGLTIADFDDAPGESNSEIGMPGRQHERETDEAAALLDLVLEAVNK